MHLTFPVYLTLFGLKLHPHFVLESIAYTVGFQLYRYLRQRWGDQVGSINRGWSLVGATLGAALGAKLLFLLEDPAWTLAHLSQPLTLIQGQTIVGGLLGGLIGVELAKKAVGERRSTGDLYVIPLAVAMAIGRVGCFLTGLADNTHGIPTSLPWAIDFGDGIPRHPAQLYEVLLLGLLILWALWSRPRLSARSGDLFKGFMILYLAFRFAIEFIKPYPTPYLGLTATQAAALLGLLYYRLDMRRVLFPPRSVILRG